MGQAALDFVQRFDLRTVLSEFERELVALVGPASADGEVRAQVIPFVKRD